ncbi:MAG TPA: 2'-5' RNA ligase family protein [Chloroflexota bacterium]|nr:2'-5' RNA ligase family protein [Chloroflexota bacterium]
MDAPVGRRVLVATVPGEAGALIQAWREKYDPKHARRLPPHLTVCYRPPVEASLEVVEAQVRHAFPAPVSVRLGPVFVLAHREAPLAVSVLDTANLDTARQKLFDARHVEMGGRHEWPWHITCIRYGHSRDRDALLAAATQELPLDAPWTIDQICCLELHSGRWEPVAEWPLG